MKQKNKITLEKKEDFRYNVYSPKGNVSKYIGEIYCLANKQKEYSIIFKKQIPCFNGPPGECEELICTGKYNSKRELEKILLEEAEKIKDKL